jgi:hypothetical protein
MQTSLIYSYASAGYTLNAPYVVIYLSENSTMQCRNNNVIQLSEKTRSVMKTFLSC